MAKRKRLTVPTTGTTPAAQGTQTERPAMPLAEGTLMPAPPRAPIADVTREASATAALQKVAGELTAAKSEGRMVQRIALNTIKADHLSRDRIAMDEEDLETLKTSIQKRGQQTPIEVMEIGDNDYGLISGFRRLQAIRSLYFHEKIDDPSILALVRTPDQSSDAYIAMVEENEIRVGLSYFERANIVCEAVRAGVFNSETAALNELFGAVSRSKRSKIKSFLPIVAHLKDALKFPQSLTERLGLSLSARIMADDDFAPKLRDRLRKADVPNAAAEMAILSKAADSGVASGVDGALSQPVARAKAVAPSAPNPVAPTGVPTWTDAPRENIDVAYIEGQMVLSGAGVTQAFAEKVAGYIRMFGTD